MAARFVRRIRVLAERRRIRNERVFRDRTNPWELYDDDAMLARYRFRRSDICVIVDALTAELDYARLGGTPVYLQIFITLRILAAGCFQLDAGDLFGLSKPTVCRIFHRVVLALSRQLQMSARFVQYCSTLSLTIVLRLDCL